MPNPFNIPPSITNFNDITWTPMEFPHVNNSGHYSTGDGASYIVDSINFTIPTINPVAPAPRVSTNETGFFRNLGSSPTSHLLEPSSGNFSCPIIGAYVNPTRVMNLVDRDLRLLSLAFNIDIDYNLLQPHVLQERYCECNTCGNSMTISPSEQIEHHAQCDTCAANDDDPDWESYDYTYLTTSGQTQEQAYSNNSYRNSLFTIEDLSLPVEAETYGLASNITPPSIRGAWADNRSWYLTQNGPYYRYIDFSPERYRFLEHVEASKAKERKRRDRGTIGGKPSGFSLWMKR